MKFYNHPANMGESDVSPGKIGTLSASSPTCDARPNVMGSWRQRAAARFL